MALDEKLKTDALSEMSKQENCIDVEKTKVISDDMSEEVPGKPVGQDLSTEGADGHSEEEQVLQSKTNDKEVNRVEFLIKPIEEQLHLLNKNIANLEKDFGVKNTEYQNILKEIDFVKCNIEKNILNVGEKINLANETNMTNKIDQLKTVITSVNEKLDRNDRQLTRTLRENANFQIQVRQGMQHDIDVLKKQQSGELFNPILKEIAIIYAEYQGLCNDEHIPDLPRSKIRALFEQMEDLFSDYGAEVVRSMVGDKRQVRTTKIMETIFTADQDKHGTIVKSRNPGVIKDRAVLYPEYVDVFVYQPKLKLKEEQDVVLGAENQDRMNFGETENVSDKKDGGMEKPSECLVTSSEALTVENTVENKEDK